MNIEDFKPIAYSWDDIFQLQKQLGFSYIPDLEVRVSHFDINIYEDQELFRTLCWRITEELTECLEAFYKAERAHVREEAIDAFNFLIELYGIYGWGSQDMRHRYSKPGGPNFEGRILDIIYRIGMCANKLKSREWRQSQYMVDLTTFEPLFKSLWQQFIELFALLGMGDASIREAWSQKYQVNRFRLRSKY